MRSRTLAGRQRWDNRCVVDPDTGETWRVDGKIDHDAGTLKVYRVYGDVNDQDGLARAVRSALEADALRAL